ncbi:hypothetical protein SAMN04488139_0426 [Pseudidiomarina donghaiensis]|nr:hypothetical protein SAMN04488139_0426 [Pseudidiomarina donghaiensis]
MMLTVATAIVTLLVRSLTNVGLLLGVAAVVVRHLGVGSVHSMRFIHIVRHVASWHWHNVSGRPRERRQQQAYNDQ